MMRSSCVMRYAATRSLLVAHGPTMFGEERFAESGDQVNSFPQNERGIRASYVFAEENTSVYEGYMPWTYFQPHEVKIDRLPAPEAKYYQHHTKRVWDISSTEQLEMLSRKRFYSCIFMGFLCIYLYFLFNDEKTYDGNTGCDGYWALQPKNRIEWFQ